jgi:outer membrane protein TolC
LFLFLFRFPLLAQQFIGDSTSLAQLWTKAESYNKELNVARLGLEQAQRKTEMTKDERLPEVGVGGEYARVSNLPMYEGGIFHSPTQFPAIHQTYDLGGEASLDVYAGGAKQRNITSSEVGEGIAAQRINLRRADIRYQVAVNDLDIYRNMQDKTLVEQDIKEREAQLKEIGNLYKRGVVLKSDVLRGELNLSKQQELLTQIENNITIANQSLNQMTGDASDHITIPVLDEDSTGTALTPLAENDFDSAIAHSYEYNILQKETELNKLELQQVKSKILPKVSLFAEYEYSYPQTLYFPYAKAIFGLGMAGVKASMSLSELYTNKQKRSYAQVAIDRSAMQEADFQDKLKVQISALHIRYNEALNRIEVAKKNIQTASETYRITRNSYFAQLSLLTDLLDAETQLLQAKMDYTTETVNARTIYYQLQKAIGNL